ncbi:MAG: phosphoribosylaminoimidazolesuccinocarboxamide synthase [Deltaproteobacteria bacterium]|nr:phosphoribosylaminoimidazolesuccinocarboxamide synthase [Deltaproteobacteria bacterium]MBI4373264.1 phosphoribosylaminoimidazolesuccinocarboxamide synthase [Deltaproteobacteria bacterium]
MVLYESNFKGLKLLFRGKVRDVYDLGSELLIVASDRLSAFDVVLPTPIPEKGEVLTALSNFWFEKLRAIIPNHLTGKSVPEMLKSRGGVTPPLQEDLAGRSVIVKKTEPLKIEAVVRGYLAGSGWKDYRKTGAVCGIPLEPGLQEAARLTHPIFTPATKAATGAHDENISFEQAARIVGQKIAEEVREASLTLYRQAAAWAEGRGIILADTKFEFGLLNGKLVWIDEALTPDSSRFWPKDQYRVGISPPSFDKQFVRDYLESIHWDKKPPAPELPEEIAKKTAEKYREALKRLSQ